MTAARPHFDVEFRVRYAETDQMGVVYHSEYLVWCEVGRTEYIRALGLPYSEMEKRGALLAVADASLRFHAPARYDDLVRVETTLTQVKSRAVTFEYLIYQAATTTRLVSARTMLVSLDRAGRPAPLPLDVRALLDRAALEGA
ncbi:MAG: acyl-CoA thioesterase [Gemmatimonadetes bacterium]|nr:acyl-CoA thioesterase [Gemmatimonadota bacterium]MCC6774860.1 acyl-CoA thioesterase [Gemmatimonadaceae bacterium]